MKAIAAATALVISASSTEARPLRVMSLDQCADQYALALAPGADLALSPRADDADSWMRAKAAGRGRVRPTLEASIGFRPDIVLRTWGGDARLLGRLKKDGVRVVSLDDATTFSGVRTNVRRSARELRNPAAGEVLIARMDRKLARETPPAANGTALYLTAGGFTAGPGTMIDAILAAAGFRNAAPSPGFGPMSVERIALTPPARFVLGFFDQVRADWRGPGRHPVVRRAAPGRTTTRLSAASLSCPAWFAADAVARLAAAS